MEQSFHDGSRAAKKGRKVNCTGKIFILLRTSVTGGLQGDIKIPNVPPVESHAGIRAIAGFSGLRV